MTMSSTPFEYFRKEAKKLFRQFRAGSSDAIQRVQAVLKDSEEVSLMRVQHVIAVENGFLKWENLIQAGVAELQTVITKRKESLLKPSETAPAEVNEHRVKLRVPPPGETPLVSFLRGPFENSTPSHLSRFADLMDTKTMKEQERWLDEDARAMGMFRK